MSKQTIFATVALIILIIGGIILYSRRDTTRTPQPVTTDEVAIRSQAEAFGKALQKVSLLAPASVLATSMDEAYGPYVAPELLAAWKTNPSQALGRQTSSPWPDRIDISSITRMSNGNYTVQGTVVEVTNATSGTQTAATYPITLTFSKRNGAWLITSVTKGAYSQPSSSSSRSATSTSAQPGEPKNTSNTVTLIGTGECLPHKNTSGPQTLECALGLRTDAGLHYALDLQAAGGFSTFTTGARMKITGTITPASALGTALEKYAIEGRINATSVEKI